MHPMKIAKKEPFVCKISFNVIMIFDNILNQETFIDIFNLYNIFENYEALVCKYIPVFTRMILV